MKLLQFSKLSQYDYLCWKNELKRKIKISLGLKTLSPRLRSRVSTKKIKQLIKKFGFAETDSGDISWFYTAYDRGDGDPLTNHNLDFIEKNISLNSEILVTGCGTGIMLFYLIDKGFLNVDGFDYLKECVLVANEIIKVGEYKANIWQDNGFDPVVPKKYDLVTAMHWVFSAWMGNYGNKVLDQCRVYEQEYRNNLLDEFLNKYRKFIKKDGMLIIELTDSVADYRLDSDSPHSKCSLGLIYPVRFSPNDVKLIANKNKMEVVEYKMCQSYGHQPRVSYMIKNNC
jgi:SAM-dependent methyltransferase